MYGILISRRDFDNMENTDPAQSKIVKVLCGSNRQKLIEKANGIVKTLSANAQKYRGWDKNEYPQFDTAEIECEFISPD